MYNSAEDNATSDETSRISLTERLVRSSSEASRRRTINPQYNSSYLLFMTVLLRSRQSTSLETTGIQIAEQMPSIQFKRSTEERDTGITCIVCFENIKWEEEEEEIIRKFSDCGHMFHHYCIEKWLMTKHSCPYCRCEVSVLDN